MSEEATKTENVDSVQADGHTANVAMKELASDDEQIGQRVREKGIAYGVPLCGPALAAIRVVRLFSTPTRMGS